MNEKAEQAAILYFWNDFKPKDNERADRHSFVAGARWMDERYHELRAMLEKIVSQNRVRGYPTEREWEILVELSKGVLKRVTRE